jgi:hypothetical protein
LEPELGVLVSDMINRLNTMLGRRELFRVFAAGTAAAAAIAPPFAAIAEEATAKSKKTQRARYQPNSSEVQTFYRVNRYPQK